MRPLLAASLFVAACASDPAATVPPELGLPAVSSARVIRNRTVDIPIEIVRNETLEGPVTIEIDGLPPGVTAQPLEIADGETIGVLQLASADDIALGTVAKATLRATAGDVVATTELALRLTDRPGSLDTTFATGGIARAHYSVAHEEVMSRVALQPDGKVVAAGNNIQLGITMVTRFNTDGTVDKEFSDGGYYPGPAAFENIVGLAVRPDGTIIVVGEGGAVSTVRVLGSNGYPITTIDLSAITQSQFAAGDMVAMPDGSFYVAGASDDSTSVLRFGPDLQLDTTFDGDGIATVSFGGSTKVSSLMRRPDGRLVVAGYAQSPSGIHYAVAQLGNDGIPDASFTGDGIELYTTIGNGLISAAELLPDGRVAAVGFSGNGYAMVNVETDGTIDMSKALPMSMFVRNAVRVNDSVLVVGAAVDYVTWNVTKFGATGFDTSFGEGGVMNSLAPAGTAHVLGDAIPFDQDRAFAVGAAAIGANSPADQALIRIWL